jgi:GDP/UDP-N,N'-diacetylbacillosamine 2-epimerase (hydrolysing)
MIESMSDFSYVLVVTNMHMLPSYGNSYKEIEKDGFHIAYKVRMSIEGNNHYSQAKSLGIFMTSLTDIVESEKPDWIMLAGDRGEQLVGAMVSAYTYTPSAHIQAGELSGNIDGMTRHAIGKYVHLHFAANDDASARLVKLGEQEFRVHNVGAPQIDEIVCSDYTSIEDIQRKYSIALSDGYIMTVLHPVTEEATYAGKQAEILVSVLNCFKQPKIVIMPNNDAGSESIKHAIRNHREGHYYTYTNLTRQDYLGLLANCLCIVGNSSSGILEAPTFKVPAVNIGRRQDKRQRGINVIDTDFLNVHITEAIEKAISDSFRSHLAEHCTNPYGDGHSSERILDVLKNTKVDEKLLVKQLTY